LQLKVLHNEADIIILGKLQIISYIFDDPSVRIFSTNVEYDDNSSSLNRYVIYIKEMNHMPLQIPEVQSIIIG